MYAIQFGDFNDIVAWSNDGLSFCINNKVAFEKAVLPVLFKPSKFDSFARNLRRWGFAKIILTGAYAEDGVAYSHPNFRRGDYALCKLMSHHGNDDLLAKTDEQQEVASILASLNTSRTPVNKSQEAIGSMADASCALSRSKFSSRRRIESFDYRPARVDEEELSNATRIVPNRMLRAQREHEQELNAILQQQLRRDPLTEAEIRMISGQHHQVPHNQLAGGRTADVIPYYNTSDPAALRTMLTRRLVLPASNGPPLSYNPFSRMAQEGGSPQQGLLTKTLLLSSDTGAYKNSNKNSNILLPLLVSTVPISGLYRSISTPPFMLHNPRIQDRKRKMSNDINSIVLEPPHSRPF